MFGQTTKTLAASLSALGALLLSDTAMAQTCGSYTYTLSNGTTANADQVMSNFNTIKGCVPFVIGSTTTTSTLSLRPTSGVGTTGADIIFQNGTNGATEAMRILNSGLVGIGTNAPTTKLTIDAGANNKIMLGQLSTGSTWNVVSLNGNASGSGATGLIAGDSGDTALYVQAASAIAFRSSGTEKMRMDSNGNLGIGASPGADLDVQKSSTGNVISRVYNTSTGSAAAARFDLTTGIANAYAIYQLQNNSGSPYLQMSVGSGVSGGIYFDSPYFIYRAPNGAERFRIDTSTGRVGVGTPSPAVALQVIGNIRVGTGATNGCLQRFDGAALAGACSSDERLKKVTGHVTGVLDRLASLDLVSFKWNETANRLYQYATTTTNTGFVAQSVEKAFPELISTDENGYEQVNYTTLQLYGLEAVKELKTANDAQAAEITTLQRELRELQQKVGVRTATNDSFLSRLGYAIGWN